MTHDPTDLSRRSLLIGTAALTAASVTPALTTESGGDIVFLIDSLGPPWIPNNSSISSFQGHI